MPPTTTILQVGALPPLLAGELTRRFAVVQEAAMAETADDVLAQVRGIATTGKATVDTVLLGELPNLEIVACLGAGTDGLDLEALGGRNVRVTTTSKVLSADVADVAMGLVIALARDLRRADRYVRDRRWADGKYPLGQALSGTNIGILGLGNIGAAVAGRAAAFGMVAGYHSRRPDPKSSLRYFESLRAMAEWGRFLVVCCPGGAATRHLVNADILRALGPESWLVNVARGSVVDEEALIAALRSGGIAGAGIDVYDNEPSPAEALLALDNTILLPHIGSATDKARKAMAHSLLSSLTVALEVR